MLLGIHVTTNAKQESLKKVAETRYEVSVREPAEKGRANKRLLELMRREYPAKIIRIVSGHHSPSKIISLDEKN